jgi:DNA-binding NtrC family response regulator
MAMAQPSVLMIEDNEDLRFIYTHFLHDMSLNLIESATAADAYRLLETDPTIQVALMDLTLPDQTAEELITRIQALRPSLRIILLSGRHDLQAQAKKFNIAQYIRKPVAMDALVSAVQKEIRN